MTCLWVCWFFLLLDQVCYWTPLVKFSIIYCIFQLNFVRFFKIVSVCWYSHSYHLTYHFPKLIERLHDYFKFFLRWFTYLISLGSVSKDLVCSFVGPCFFLCLVILCWHPHIWKKSQLQSLGLALFYIGKDLHQLVSLKIHGAPQTFSVDASSLDLRV